MSRFELDMIDVREGNGKEVIIRRRSQLKEIEKAGRSCKNSFRRQCLAQEYVKLAAELEELEDLI